AADERALVAATEHGGEGEVERRVDRRRAEQRPDQPQPQRQRATLDQVADDAQLLLRRRRIDLADELRQAAGRALVAEDEAEDTHHQREERDESEEDLVGERAREERTVIFDERARDADGKEGGGSAKGS